MLVTYKCSSITCSRETSVALRVEKEEETNSSDIWNKLGMVVWKKTSLLMIYIQMLVCGLLDLRI